MTNGWQTVIKRTSFREEKGFEGWPTRYECPLIRALGYSPREYACLQDIS